MKRGWSPTYHDKEYPLVVLKASHRVHNEWTVVLRQVLQSIALLLLERELERRMRK